jgi:MMP 1-O-methyltransferase
MRLDLHHRLAQAVHAAPAVGRLLYRIAYGPVGVYLAEAWRIPGFLARNEARTLAHHCSALPRDAVIVEVGAFLGRSAVVMAGARKLAGSGLVHCIDPFDASGDDFSAPVYAAMADQSLRSLRQRFDDHLTRARLSNWVRVYQGTAESVAVHWSQPIDLLFLAGDQSPRGARRAYDCWAPFLRIGGIIGLQNSRDRVYDPTHEGNRLLVKDTVRPPLYEDVVCVDSTTFARKRG